MKMYLVGGSVRDGILGRSSKDLDYTVVLSPETVQNNVDPFSHMSNELKLLGYEIFVESPEFFTVRARHPDSGLTSDFVLARKDGKYSDGRRPDSVSIGSLDDDLDRRDFTMNAIAYDVDTKELYDPHEGVQDINDGVIRCVGDPLERLTEDALRAVRALRFSVTLDYRIDYDLGYYMEHDAVIHEIYTNIADERIQVELSKMFRFNTVKSIWKLSEFDKLTRALFSGTVSLDSTMKTKGRGGVR